MENKVKKSFDAICSEIISANSIDCNDPSDLAGCLCKDLAKYIEKGEISIEDALFEMFSMGTNYGGMM